MSASSRVRLVLVRLERLLEPVDAEPLELAGDPDRGRGVGHVAEPGVDHDLDAVAPRRAAAAASVDVVVRILCRAAPSRA